MTDETMSHDEVNRILDTCRPGDHLTVTRTNGGNLTSAISGPVLCEPDLGRAVGIDLLDGEPHIVRDGDGLTWGQFVRVELLTAIDPTAGHDHHPSESAARAREAS